MEFFVLYSSRTGNTEKVAEAIFDALPGRSKLIEPVEDYDGTENPGLVFLGFAVNRGSCPMDVTDVLEKLEGKRLALFATCGMGDEAYQQRIRHNIDVWMPDDYIDLGFFCCQGAISPAFLKEMREHEDSFSPQMLEAMEAQQQKSVGHPDAADLDRARQFAKEVLGRAGRKEQMRN
ncbi:MAG: flavodoxin family protein [Clostridiales bacterium]|nr:flavodoxin family protein [Clostridiales bacterium]